MLQKGTVKSFTSARGYGFIQPDSGAPDIFAHFSNVEGEGYKTLHAGQRVEFDIEKDDTDRDQAVNVKTDMSEVITEF
jgi:CspA family cold shock protein